MRLLERCRKFSNKCIEHFLHIEGVCVGTLQTHTQGFWANVWEHFMHLKKVPSNCVGILPLVVNVYWKLDQHLTDTDTMCGSCVYHTFYIAFT